MRLLNRPILNGEVCSAEEYTGELAGGFVAMYRLLMTKREQLLSGESGPLQSFRGLKAAMRAVPLGRRITQLSPIALVHPDFLRDGSRTVASSSNGWIRLQSLKRMPIIRRHGVSTRRVKLLKRLDVRYFNFVSDSDARRCGRVHGGSWFLLRTELELCDYSSAEYG